MKPRDLEFEESTKLINELAARCKAYIVVLWPKGNPKEEITVRWGGDQGAVLDSIKIAVSEIEGGEAPPD